MITERHPFYFLLPLFQKEDIVFSLSKYVYIPDSLFDEREYFSISGQDFSETRINLEIASLRSDQELALHSNVRIRGKTFHIPMIDFSTEESVGSSVFDRMSRYLPKSLMLNMGVYASGRSFHAYSTTLLSPKEWLNFMGRLLLVNPCREPEIVDTRWIGHRLIGGFGSLRWSNNSRQYLSLPSRITFP
ncbi:hypothetical protein SAMN05216315_11412 [Nitrosospira sp. Nsp18]|uniref:primase 1D-like protein n=1 Tax=Nitrosospira sp. Nsp18 TaxID=1855334 RepID=UPI00087FBC05|nr:hypothetical protein [Nitrosospira sp. Nsp18]SDA20595.1 hypothetical protein SAMN05216315_11412 [Nitrosospira sp. Nsp18]